MSGPPVTVAVITHDRRPELLRTLGFMTALPERPRVIVVDNGSGDGTADAVAEAFPEVRMIRSDENLGAVGRNVAVEQVETPYVAFCDDDTWWEAGALTLAAGLLRTYPKLASVTGRILVEPDLREDPITPELRDSPIPRPYWMPVPALLSILAGASMVRVRAFREVGGFSPRLWLGGEEELLSLDLVSRGWWLGWAEDVIVHHAASRVRDRRGRRMVGIRNTLWTAWLRRPPGGALRRTAAVLRAVPKDRASAAAVAAAVAGLPWVLRERRVVPTAVEDGLRLLEEPQRTSVARRYVD
ncbi:glycosyltransferase [Sphaerisporangium sp. B11E5]|uniref:glycosyltransferase family 2 protein n=1 Tax=Sphaerisporangium sp. B11E5 TaxID=3153563 RepID=UPI00325E907A